jgi:hypothetical protein
MVGSRSNEWGATRIWHGRAPRDTLPPTAQPFFLFFVFAGLLPPFSPFFLAILETYGIQAIHLHPKSVTLLAVFAYACEAWIASSRRGVLSPPLLPPVFWAEPEFQMRLLHRYRRSGGRLHRLEVDEEG